MMIEKKKLTKDDLNLIIEQGYLLRPEAEQILKNQEDAEKWNQREQRLLSASRNAPYKKQPNDYIIERLKERIEELNPKTKTYMEDMTEHQFHILEELQKILGEEK